MRLRMPGAGVHRDPALAPGGTAFVVTLLATVVFDGFGRTPRWFDLVNWIESTFRSPLAGDGTSVRTIAMLIVVGVFAAAYLLVAGLMAAFEGPASSARGLATPRP